MRRFFAAVAAADGGALWELLSEDARAYVLNVAVEQGMDFDLGSRLRQGTASEDERAEYLANLVEGIRYDLRGVDVEKLVFEFEPEPESSGHVRATYLVEVGAGSSFDQRIPAGALVMVHEPDGWRILRLRPIPGG